MPRFVLTARNTILLSGGQIVERGRQVEVFVNSSTAQANNLFDTPYGKEAISRAFSIQGIPPTPNYMNGAKWDVKLANYLF